MIPSSHLEKRKEMFKAISEYIAPQAVYMCMLSWAYQIEKITVNRDGTIMCYLPLFDSLKTICE